jgi:hypothetical protein
MWKSITFEYLKTGKQFIIKNKRYERFNKQRLQID